MFLWPDHDPELQWFTPHFRSLGAYNPDRPPALGDMGGLLPGSFDEGISIYRDGQGGQTFIKAVEITSLTDWPDERRPSQ